MRGCDSGLGITDRGCQTTVQCPPSRRRSDMRIQSGVLAAVACAGMTPPGAGAAQTAAPPTASTATNNAANRSLAAKPRLICTEEEVVGTRFTKKTCLTEQHW